MSELPPKAVVAADIEGRLKSANTGHASYSITSSVHYWSATILKLIKSVRLSVEALGFKGSFVAFALF